MAAAANCAGACHLYKPLVSSTGSQLCWHGFPGSLAGIHHASGLEKLSPDCRRQLTMGVNCSVKLRVCSLAYGGNSETVIVADSLYHRGSSAMQHLIFVDDGPSAAIPNGELATDIPDVLTNSAAEATVLPNNAADTAVIPSPEPLMTNEPPQSSEILAPGNGTGMASEGGGQGLLEVPKVESGTSPSDALSAGSNEAFDAIRRTADSATNSLTELQENGVNFLTNVRETVTNSISNAGNSVKHIYDDINGSILKAINGTVPDDAVSVQSSLKSAGEGSLNLTSPFRTGTPINNALKEVVIFVKNGTGTVLVAVGHTLSEVYSSIKSVAPSGVQTALNITEKKVQEILIPLSSALQQAFDYIAGVERALGVDPENPIIPIILVVGGTVYLGLVYWQAKYGGYSGDLSPDSVFDLLRKEDNVVLVDIRPQGFKEKDGIPDVRRGARYKVATVDPIQVERSVRNLLRNADDIDNILTATIIRNLKNVKPNTKVIVMDADGTQSKKVARALRQIGIKRPYRLDGGFVAWTKYGLRQKAEGPETPLTVLKQETEAIIEEVKPTPAGITAVALGSVASVYAAIEWEKTLQLLGVIAIVQAIYQRVNSYESADDLKADIRILQKPFKLGIQGVLWVTGQAKPSKLELATSPSTTAVQDRVLQAAAKHGPLPSELEQEEQQATDQMSSSDEGPQKTNVS